MVYGLNIKSLCGYHPDIKLLDGDLNQVRAINPINDGGVGWAGRAGGVPVDGTHFPKHVKWLDKRGNGVADFDSSPTLNVSERAKQVIESIEPGVHQFFPVEYVNIKGKFLENRYWFVIGNRVDGVDRQNSNMVLVDGVEWVPPKTVMRLGDTLPPNVDPSKPPHTFFNLNQIGNVNIWCDKHLSFGRYVSSTAAHAMTEAGLTGVEFIKEETI